jgi:hypothetical protein
VSGHPGHDINVRHRDLRHGRDRPPNHPSNWNNYTLPVWHGSSITLGAGEAKPWRGNVTPLDGPWFISGTAGRRPEQSGRRLLEPLLQPFLLSSGRCPEMSRIRTTQTASAERHPRWPSPFNYSDVVNPAVTGALTRYASSSGTESAVSGASDMDVMASQASLAAACSASFLDRPLPVALTLSPTNT